jgi:hypothetical protein
MKFICEIEICYSRKLFSYNNNTLSLLCILILHTLILGDNTIIRSSVDTWYSGLIILQSYF